MCANGAARAIREHSDLSLREVADHLDVSIATLSGWERDAQRPTGERAVRYLDLLLELSQRRGHHNVVRPEAHTERLIPTRRRTAL